MYDQLKEEQIVNKVGGRFKLSTLIQKRLVQLNQGARPLIDTNLTDRMAIVLREIELNKIHLDTSNEVRLTDAGPPEFTSQSELDLDDL
jgi:DNA-directed RNA polymerase subunit omega